MKVLQITPIWPSAITTLCRQIVRHNTKKADIKLVTCHPKRPDQREIDQIRSLWKWCDLVDVQYWKSGAKVRELFPDLWPTKKKIISHYNPYNLNEENWQDYTVSVVVNSYQQSVLPQSRMIPLCIDLDFFKFNRSSYTTEPVVNMSVSRIESKKGVIQVAQSCHDLGYKFLLVGRVSDGEYMDRVKKAAGKMLDFRNNVSDDEVKKAYYQSAVHVCNSKDNFESGTMPVMESMACGLPVLTRRVGHVPDLYDGKNMHILETGHEDVENIKAQLSLLMNDRRHRISMRNHAVDTIQPRSDKWRAEEYRKLYEEVLK